MANNYVSKLFSSPEDFEKWIEICKSGFVELSTGRVFKMMINTREYWNNYKGDKSDILFIPTDDDTLERLAKAIIDIGALEDKSTSIEEDISALVQSVGIAGIAANSTVVMKATNLRTDGIVEKNNYKNGYLYVENCTTYQGRRYVKVVSQKGNSNGGAIEIFGESNGKAIDIKACFGWESAIGNDNYKGTIISATSKVATSPKLVDNCIYLDSNDSLVYNVETQAVEFIEGGMTDINSQKHIILINNYYGHLSGRLVNDYGTLLADISELQSKVSTAEQDIDELQEESEAHTNYIAGLKDGTMSAKRAEKADLATNANNATNATTAVNATYAKNAENAGKATNANFAGYATKAEDSIRVNGLEIKQDTNGVLKIGDIVIPQRKQIYVYNGTGDFKPYQSDKSTVVTNLPVKNGDYIEVEYGGDAEVVPTFIFRLKIRPSGSVAYSNVESYGDNFYRINVNNTEMTTFTVNLQFYDKDEGKFETTTATFGLKKITKIIE